MRVEATSDAIATLMQSDPAKVKVMGHFRKLVADGFAEWQTIQAVQMLLARYGRTISEPEPMR